MDSTWGNTNWTQSKYILAEKNKLNMRTTHCENYLDIFRNDDPQNTIFHKFVWITAFSTNTWEIGAIRSWKDLIDIFIAFESHWVLNLQLASHLFLRYSPKFSQFSFCCLWSVFSRNQISLNTSILKSFRCIIEILNSIADKINEILAIDNQNTETCNLHAKKLLIHSPLECK